MSGKPRHGHARHTPGGTTPTYETWRSMKERCSRPAHPHFHSDGGRGIAVCERWGTFENFLADMGERPAGTSLDRINNDGNYEPGNCRWATTKEQRRNSRQNRFIEFRGERLTLTDWAARLGLKTSALRYRMDAWTKENAMTTPALRIRKAVR